MKNSKPKLIIHSRDHLMFITQDEITHCKSDNCYTTIYVCNFEEHVICKSLTKTLKELDPENFIRVNQSYVVNKNHIKAIDKKNKIIELTGKHRIPFTTSINELLALVA